MHSFEDTIAIHDELVDVMPDSSYTIEFERDLQFAVEGTCVLHFMIQYENLAGDLFESYYWAKYKTNIPDIGFQMVQKDGKEGIAIIRKTIPVDSIFTLLDFRGGPFIYTKDEADHMREVFKEVYKR